MNIPAPFASVDVNFTNKSKYSLLLDNTVGVASVTYGPNFPGPGNATNPTPTGLANDGTAYTATVLVDGTHTESVSVVGSAAQTFTTLISEINADLGGFAVAALVGNQIVITSNLTGAVSAVTITDTGTYPLFASVKGIPVNVVNGASTTITNYQFGLVASASKSVRGGTNYAVWNRFHNSTQSIIAAAIDSFLAASTNGIATIGAPTTNAGYALSAHTYTSVPLTGGSGSGALASVHITVLGVVDTVTVTTAGTGYKVGDVLSAAASDLGGVTPSMAFTVAVATLTAGNTNQPWTSGVEYITLTPIAPATTVVNATDTGLVTGSGTSAQTLANTTYNLNVNVDSAGAVNITIALPILENVSQPITFLHLVDAIEYALTAAGVLATAVLVPGATNQIAIISKSVGTSSAVLITAGTGNDLLVYLGASNPAGFNFGAAAAGAAAGVNGTTDASFPVVKFTPSTVGGANEDNLASGKSKTFTNWNDVMQFWPSTTGFGALWTTGTEATVFKGKTPLAKGDAFRTAVYYDGSNWVYFDTGATITGATPPPELPAY